MTIEKKLRSVYRIKEVGVASPGEVEDFFFEEHCERMRQLYNRDITGVKNTPLYDPVLGVKRAILDDRDSGEEVLRQYLSEQKKDLSISMLSFLSNCSFADGIVVLLGSHQTPFSHRANVELMMMDSHYATDNALDYQHSVFSTTGIAFKRRSTKFKINPDCKQLINMKYNFRKEFIPVNYDSLKVRGGWVEFDLSKSNCKYNHPLTPDEARNHEAHLAAMNNNVKLWGRFVDFWFGITGKEKGLGFNIIGNYSTDRLHPLVIDGSSGNFEVCGFYCLDDRMDFLSFAKKVF